MLCLQLFVHRGTLGALDLLARETSAFTDEYEHVGLLLAACRHRGGGRPAPGEHDQRPGQPEISSARPRHPDGAVPKSLPTRRSPYWPR